VTLNTFMVKKQH